MSDQRLWEKPAMIAVGQNTVKQTFRVGLINVRDLGIATECELERALLMRTYRYHDNLEYVILTYENLEGAHQLPPPCSSATTLRKNRQTTS